MVSLLGESGSVYDEPKHRTLCIADCVANEEAILKREC